MIPRPRLRTILLGVNLLVLIVPVVGIAGLRIYETELIRRTEAEVIAQAALIKAEVERELGEVLDEMGHEAFPEGHGHAVAINWPVNIEDRFRPINPTLNSSREPVLEPEPPAEPPRGAVDAIMFRVGQRMEPALIETQKITLSGMRIVDWNGNTVASTSSSDRDMSLFHRPEVHRALEDGEIVRLLRRRDTIPEQTSLQSLSRETSVRVFVSIPIAYDDRIVGAVTVWRTPISLPRAIYENGEIFGILLGLMLLSGLAIAALTSFYIGRPIQRLIAQTERVTRNEGDGTEPIGKPGTFEVQRLSESIAEMAAALEDRADYIRTFARSVSHEFKTPLTSIRGTVELLQDHLHEMDEGQREEFLDILDADARRLDHLVRRMLELAKADVTRPGDAHVDFVTLAEKVADAYVRDDFHIEIDAPDQGPELAIGEEALHSILSNLIINARQHGGKNVSISLEVDDAEKVAKIRVADDGPGISEGNAARIFDDFFTTARDDGGTGLGLSITRTLVEAHGGSIELSGSESASGATFAIEIPTS